MIAFNILAAGAVFFGLFSVRLMIGRLGDNLASLLVAIAAALLAGFALGGKP